MNWRSEETVLVHHSPGTTHHSLFLKAVFFLLHFPDPSSTARLNRTVGVTHHRVLWSPDFPLPDPPLDSPKRIERLSEQRPSGRPADHHLLYSASSVQFTRSQ